MVAVSQSVKDRAAAAESARRQRAKDYKAAQSHAARQSQSRKNVFHSVTGTRRTQAIAEGVGVSWLSVVISLLMFAFLLYIYANGSMKVYYSLLFTSSTATGPAPTGTHNVDAAKSAAPSMADSSVTGEGEEIPDSGEVN